MIYLGQQRTAARTHTKEEKDHQEQDDDTNNASTAPSLSGGAGTQTAQKAAQTTKPAQPTAAIGTTTGRGRAATKATTTTGAT